MRSRDRILQQPLWTVTLWADHTVGSSRKSQQILDTDRYGRAVAVVSIDGKILNEEALKAGMAWVYGHYCKEYFCNQWLEYQESAKKSKVGLWSMPNPIPPWEFRHPQRGISSHGEIQPPERSVVYHGNVSSKVFHKPDCQHYNCKNCTAIFTSRDEAIAAGYKSCGMCNP